MIEAYHDVDITPWAMFSYPVHQVESRGALRSAHAHGTGVHVRRCWGVPHGTYACFCVEHSTGCDTLRPPLYTQFVFLLLRIYILNTYAAGLVRLNS